MANPAPPRPIIGGNPAAKPKRFIEVAPAINGEHFYRVTGRNGEIVYTSETFATKTGARKAAIREHEGRTNYEYVLKWLDERTGKIVSESLD